MSVSVVPSHASDLITGIGRIAPQNAILQSILHKAQEELVFARLDRPGKHHHTVKKFNAQPRNVQIKHVITLLQSAPQNELRQRLQNMAKRARQTKGNLLAAV